MISHIIREMNETDISNVLKYDIVMLGETLGENTIKDHLRNSSLMKYFIMETKASNDFIGHLSVWLDDGKAQINNFYIIHEYQKLKLGREFMNYIFRYFKTVGINEVTLEVRKSNKSAIGLYRAFNFQEISVRKNYYKNGEDASFMYLRIGSD